MRKQQSWRPDTHPEIEIIEEWDTEDESHRRGVNVIINGTSVPINDVDYHYRRIVSEHVIKNHAHTHIVESLPDFMMKEVLDEDGDPTGRKIVKVKHAPKWEHLGDGHYEFEVPGLLKVDKERINYSLAEKHGSRAKIKD